MRERIVRMNLNRQRFFGEQQFEQQSRVWRFHIRALKPKFADRDAVRLDIAPGQEIGAPPGFAHNSRAGMFDRHDVLLFVAGSDQMRPDRKMAASLNSLIEWLTLGSPGSRRVWKTDQE